MCDAAGNSGHEQRFTPKAFIDGDWRQVQFNQRRTGAMPSGGELTQALAIHARSVNALLVEQTVNRVATYIRFYYAALGRQ
jgi:hypothetical protein